MSAQTFMPSDSSLISEYRYDDDTWVMSIRFRGTGELRLYSEFPPDLADDFENSKSKGKFFNAHIARKFPVQKDESGTTIDAPPAKPVEADPGREADIAALEAIWVSEKDSRLGLADEPTYGGIDRSFGDRSLFGDPMTPTVKAMNGFDPQESQIETKTVPAKGWDTLDPGQPGGKIHMAAAEVVPEPEILSPEQAVAVISPKSPKADALTAEAHRMAAVVIDVKDDASYTKLFEHTQRLTTVRKALFDLIDPYREIAYRAYEAIQNLNKSRLGPPDVAIKGNKAKLLAYEEMLAKKKAEAQRLADAKAAADAEAERLRVQEELTLAEVSDALAVGDTAKAEDLIANPIQVAPMQVYADRVADYTPPPTSGGSTRKNWKAEVKDRDALILDIAAGIEHFTKHGHLGGHAPDSFLDFNEAKMNSEARNKENKMVYPGVRVWNAAVKNIKGA